MKVLLQDADVFVQSYRHEVVNRFGIDHHSAAKLTKKGIIYLSINTYGHEGIWCERPGFDHIAQMATGFSAKEGSLENPQYSPVFYLTDLIAGYLAASGVMAALLRRATEGGSYHVKVSLSKSAMWVQDLGYVADELLQTSELSRVDTYPAKLMSVDTTYGEITQLAPAYTFSNMPTVNLTRLVPFGADAPEFTSKEISGLCCFEWVRGIIKC